MPQEHHRQRGTAPTFTPPAERPQFRIVVDPGGNCRRFRPCDVDCDEGPFLFPSGIADSLTATVAERCLVLLFALWAAMCFLPLPLWNY